MFDYNINHYEKNELEDFFELKENEYDINLIENKKNRIKNGIVEDKIILPSECPRLHILTLIFTGNIDCNLICIGIM